MKKAVLLVMLLGFALCLPGCGFTEGTDAVVTVVKATPTPIPTPTPEPTPTPAATPTPAPVIEQTPSGINVTVEEGEYTATADPNLRGDATPDGELITGVEAGTVLHGTGVCENGWIRIEYEGQTVYATGDYLSKNGASSEAPAEPAGDELTSEANNL